MSNKICQACEEHMTQTTLIDVEFEDGHIETWDWPFCQVDGCENRICLGVSKRFCHPHSGGNAADKLIEQINQPQKVPA